MVRSVEPRASRAGGESQPIIFLSFIIMAKGNMLLGFSRGSVGDLTFYRRNSQQVTRARARVVKNPKTLAQQMQRAIMRTSVEAYKVLKGICDHSWEGVAYGANSYAEFQHQNMAMLRRLAAAGGENAKSFLPSGFNGVVAMPWVLSKGSIAWSGFKEVLEGQRIYFNGTTASAETIDAMTYARVAEYLGCSVGDQVTLVYLPKRRDIDESAANEAYIARFILSPSTGDPAETQAFDANGRVINANPLNEGMQNITFSISSRNLCAQLETSAIDPDDNIIGVAAIISRRNAAGAWLRSDAVLLFDEAQQEGGYTLRQASLVASAEIVTPSDWYLNNANETPVGE